MVKSILKKYKIKIFVALSVILLLCFAIMTQIDFLGDFVLSELNKAITERFAAELSLNPVSGNPITGFQIDNFSFYCYC